MSRYDTEFSAFAQEPTGLQTGSAHPTRTRPRPAGVSGIFKIPLPPRARTHAGTEQRTAGGSPGNVPARVPAGVSGIFKIPLPPRARTHAGTIQPSPSNSPAFVPARVPAGVSGIFKFLFLRVRGRTRVRSTPHPATRQLPYPPASRGREWNLQNSSSSACGDARGYDSTLTPPAPPARQNLKPRIY